MVRCLECLASAPGLRSESWPSRSIIAQRWPTIPQQKDKKKTKQKNQILAANLRPSQGLAALPYPDNFFPGPRGTRDLHSKGAVRCGALEWLPRHHLPPFVLRSFQFSARLAASRSNLLLIKHDRAGCAPARHSRARRPGPIFATANRGPGTRNPGHRDRRRSNGMHACVINCVYLR